MRWFWFCLLICGNLLLAEDEKKVRRDDIELVKKLHAQAVASAKSDVFEDYKNSYEALVRGRDLKEFEYEMVAIEGGEFTMGSRAEEDEQPVQKVRVSPFWMGKFEVSWDLYDPFMITGSPRAKDGQILPGCLKPDSPDHLIVSKPTSPYTDMSFGMGLEGFPAVCMTQHAASKFCQWLSAKTGHYYRLPTEAEWEYACRAGTTGRFSCPDEEIEAHAVCEYDIDNPKLYGYAKIGTKKPNPWGLYDMHGNVMEWCLDQYNSKTYFMRRDHQGIPVDPLVMANRIYPRVARGGSWYDPPEDCTSTRRWFSEPGWQMQDPQVPKSIWHLTDALWLGFRIVRPHQVPDVEEMDQLWNSAHPDRVVKDKRERR